jgi:Tol biopolymer transport system component
MIGVDPSDVQAQLERIVASNTFSSSSRASRFLRFCVEQSLKGDYDQIKETVLAVEVFGRTPDYDPKADPIVRVHAKRLRDRLDSYYAAEGLSDPIRIYIPKGSYVPCAERHFGGSFTSRFGASAPVPVGHTVAAPASAKPRALPAPAMRKILWALVFAGLCGLLCVLSISIVRPKRRPDQLSVRGAVLPLNAAPGIEQNPSWSPDGKFAAFSWSGDRDAVPAIYVQRIGDAAPVRLTNNSEADYRPVWSPDGHQIAFIRYLNSGMFEVSRISISDRKEIVVGQFSFDGLQSYMQPGLDWSPDGRSLLVADKPSQTAPVRLLIVDLATGIRRPLTDPPAGSAGDLEGKFSPNGELVAFHRGGLGDIYVVSTSGETKGAARRLTPDNPGVMGIAWSRDSRHILFGSMEDGHGWGIWQVSVEGGAPASVLTGNLDLTAPAVSPDGRHLAIEQRDVVTNLLAISLPRGKAAHPFAPSSRQDSEPAFAPDGKQVVFVSTRSGSLDLWLASSNGSAIRQLTRLNGNGFPVTPSWSPDGKRIVFAIRRTGTTNLAVAGVADGAVKMLTDTPYRNINPFYDPEGRYIYYNSNADGMPRIWRIAGDGVDGPEPMFWDVPPIFALSLASRSIYYFHDSDAGVSVGARDLSTGAQRAVYTSPHWFIAPGDFCVHKKMLYMLSSREGDPSHQELVAFDTGSTKSYVMKDFEAALPSMDFGCAVSPDGDTLLLPEVERFSSDIYVAALGADAAHPASASDRQ